MSKRVVHVTKLQNDLVVRTLDGTELLRSPDTTVKRLKELINENLGNMHFVMRTPENDNLLGWKRLIGHKSTRTTKIGQLYTLMFQMQKGDDALSLLPSSLSHCK